LEPITLILTALAAGASSGALAALSDGVKDGVKSAYAKLRTLVGRRTAGNQVAETALAQYEASPEAWRAPLADELAKAGAAGDQELLAAAQALLALLNPAEAKAGRYRVTVKDSKGVQVGDGNVQVNRF